MGPARQCRYPSTHLGNHVRSDLEVKPLGFTLEIVSTTSDAPAEQASIFQPVAFCALTDQLVQQCFKKAPSTSH